MTDDCDSYRREIERVISGRATAAVLSNGAVRLQHLEREFNARILAASPDTNAVSFPHVRLTPLEYWGRNFFSILLMSVFEAIGISEERQRHYGLVLHALRGIVTAADNIIDGQNKGPV